MSEKTYKILTLDGGGAKGFYTLGILREVEASLGSEIHNHFDLIYGTSTGAIIAALLALGKSVDEVHAAYCEHIPKIMGPMLPSKKSEALKRVGEQVLGELSFIDVKTGLGIVATRWNDEYPIIFKSDISRAFGRRSTFVPGFGCSISDAVQASASAYPFFDRKTVRTSQGDLLDLADGGYCANNPTLFAIGDATSALKVPRQNCRVLSLGTGRFPEKNPGPLSGILKRLPSVKLVQKLMEISSSSTENNRKILYPDIPALRIDGVFDHPSLSTNMFETDASKLNKLRQKGAESFGYAEVEFAQLLSL